MSRILAIIWVAILLTACKAEQPLFTDNGKPGAVRVIVYVDENRNGAKDPDEAGVPDRVSIGQDISCPVGNNDKIIKAETDASGETIFTDLKAGRYCVMYNGSLPMTSKITVEVDLSSEQTIQVFFAVVPE